jgi:hypothetical protein
VGLRIGFNPKAFEVLAKELRRASWGVVITAGAGGYKLEDAWLLVTGALVWMLLQIAALALQSVQNDEEGGAP